jgi:glycosyltransferase involved in cell wall biosynthesis
LPISFIGELGRGAPVAEFLRSLDVFVLPSTHREGRANVLLEALSCGIPTLATDIPGTMEAVGDGATLVPPNDAPKLADGIRSLIGRPDARERALAHAARIADFVSLAESYRRVFEDAIGRQAAARARS